MRLLHSGKVRDVYADGDDIILVASDRVSVYDVVLPTPVPDKGRLLTALSLWWFDRLADVIPNHVISADDVPAEFAGRAVRCRRLEMIDVECVARGYLAGSALNDYRDDDEVSGIGLPAGLREGDRLPEPIFTPSTKAPMGSHDMPISYHHVVGKVGPETARRLRDVTMEIYRRASELALSRGLLVADTKLEFGVDAAGELCLGDELLTPDSSRFWPADQWSPGGPQPSFDKQFVRDWAAGTGWDKREPAPELPEDVVEATRRRYVEAYERITGLTW
ncbi:phosphoribosylaminoimidazole-succinocarboxamide synthase [Stackebrandtia albiflava]|uniref:Phosphoribosylaminoimidazole-succinocarboxamide synthase n=1 Tax=Stackebrandtia albiflava TaxID=406432 RepID=A0A562UQL1_9ACTN|nr:phosphoribosylaminoimidazolesuccinocarboxamide synthase [Stackebrandtia albiflava]TWJ07915.1 phosphoribosylaminoimidazole-succinocarboxamide synthase [Stackebrandtia albiflava]